MSLKIIVAVATNGVIGKEDGIPWKLPGDMKWFREKTGKNPVVMGRKTFLSLPDQFRPLPGRENIVLTRSRESFDSRGATLIDSFDPVVKRSEKEDLWVIGGAEVYRIALPHTQEMYLTRVQAVIEGDIFFPEWNRGGWTLEHLEHHPRDEKNEFSFTWEIYRRRIQPTK